MVGTGENRCEKDKGAVTSLAFDHEFSRLLVGCTDGHVRLYNYGNGLLLKRYALKSPADISGLCSAFEAGEVLLYAGTESAEVYMWKDTEESTTLRPIAHDRLNTSAHELDVSCIVHVPPDYLITCSFDGRVVVWQRGVLKHSLTDPTWADRPIMSVRMCPFVPSDHSDVKRLLLARACVSVDAHALVCWRIAISCAHLL